MHLTLTALLALLPAFALTKPVASPNGIVIPLVKRSSLVDNGALNASAVPEHLAQLRAKVLRGMDNYRANTGVAHPNDRRNHAKRDIGTVPLTIFNHGQLWYGTVSVGTPSVDFTVDFDTGSSDLFLPSPQCQDNCGGHSLYDPTASSTAVDINKDFTIAFADESSVAGKVYTDTVVLGGLTATGQALAAATNYSTGLRIQEFPSDGLMGMGFPQIAENGSPVFQTLVAQSQTDSPVFTFTLAETDSELFIGEIDGGQFDGDITFVKVTTPGFWQVIIDSIQLGDQVINSDFAGIIDTGATLVVGDTPTVKKFYQGVSGAADQGDGTYTIPCDSTIDASLTFAGENFPIPPDIFVVRTEEANLCFGGLSYMDMDLDPDTPNLWIVGDIFLRSFYTIFDVGNQQVGFADLAH